MANKIKNGNIDICAHDEFGDTVIKISDNAGGISPKIADKIFDPYFTTKFEANGTGLGLYMAKMIIEDNMGGKITFKNRANGVEFKITCKNG